MFFCLYYRIFLHILKVCPIVKFYNLLYNKKKMEADFIMKRKFVFLILISLLIAVIYFLNSFRAPYKKDISYLIMSDKYLISKPDYGYLNNSLIFLDNREMTENDKNNEIDTCLTVTKMAMIKDYYIGYVTGENDKYCKGYFYIKKDAPENRIGLSEKEIEEKFGKNIKYENPSDFMNKYGIDEYGQEYYSENLKTASIILFFFCFLIIGAGFIIYSNIFKIIKNIKEKEMNYKNKVRIILTLTLTAGFLASFPYFSYNLLTDSYKTNWYIHVNSRFSIVREYTELYSSAILLNPYEYTGIFLDDIEEVKNRYTKSESDRYKDKCGEISKIAIIGGYYAGYRENSDNKNCKGYFYVKKGAPENRIGLSEQQIEQKFGKNIKYENPSKFINKNGSGGHYINDFSSLLIMSIYLFLYYLFVIGLILFGCDFAIDFIKKLISLKK